MKANIPQAGFVNQLAEPPFLAPAAGDFKRGLREAFPGCAARRPAPPNPRQHLSKWRYAGSLAAYRLLRRYRKAVRSTILGTILTGVLETVVNGFREEPEGAVTPLVPEHLAQPSVASENLSRSRPIVDNHFLTGKARKPRRAPPPEKSTAIRQHMHHFRLSTAAARSLAMSTANEGPHATQPLGQTGDLWCREG